MSGMNSDIKVIWRDKPFEGRVHQAALPQGLTCAEIIATVPNVDTRLFLEAGTFCINGEPVPRDMWVKVRPKANRNILVTMHLPLLGGGGGGGGKNTIRIIATIALLVVATVITGGAFGPEGLAIAGELFAAGSISAQILAGAVTIGGALLLGAFVKPPSQSIDDSRGGREVDGAAGQASLQGNLLRRGAPVPRVCGTMRVFPPFLAQPLVEVVDGYNEIIEGVYGFAGPHKQEALRFGDTPVSEFAPEDLQLEVFEALPTDADPTLFSRYGKTANPNVTLSKHVLNTSIATQPTRDPLLDQSTPANSYPRPHVFTIRHNRYDELWMTIALPGGMGYFDTDFNLDWHYGIPFRLRVREVGTATWINLPEIHLTDRRSAFFSRMIVFRWDQFFQNTDPPAAKGWRTAYSSVPTQTLTPSGQGGWTANSHFYSGSGPTYLVPGLAGASGVRNVRLTTARAEFYLDGLVPQGPLEVEITRGQLYPVQRFTAATYIINRDPPTSGTGVMNFFGHFNESSTNVILLKNSGAQDTVAVSRIAAVWNDPPVRTKGEFATVYVRARGQQLEALSVLASGYVPDWDGSDWTGFNATSNPAPHYRDVLTGKLNADPIPPEILDNESLLEWRDRCTLMDFTVDAVFEGLAASRCAEVIASCGYAQPRHSEKWDVAADQDFTDVPPTQMFTPRNMRGFRWEKAFVRRRPDGFRVEFNDKNDDYRTKQIIVPRPGIMGDRAAILEDIRYDGLVDEVKVVTKASYDQQQSIDRFTFYRGSVDAEHLVCRRGDLVVVQHDILDHHAGYSRIQRVIYDGDDVIGIVLDGSVSPSGSKFFIDPSDFFIIPTKFFSDIMGISVRQKDGTLITFSGYISEDGLLITPRVPIADLDEDNFSTDCLVTTGRLTKEYRRLIVLDITPRNEFTADITFVDEAPQLQRLLPPVPLYPVFEGGDQMVSDIEELLLEMSMRNTVSTPRLGMGTLTINGQICANNYEYVIRHGDVNVQLFFDTDWFTNVADNPASFIVIDGDLTIDADIVFTPPVRKLFTAMLITGDLILNGEISMSRRGANHGATGSNIPAVAVRWMTGVIDGVTNPSVASSGAAGGAARTTSSADQSLLGNDGADAVNGETGGGGSGGLRVAGGASGTKTSGAGAPGSPFGGGPGGGGAHLGSTGNQTAQSGVSNGGKGGNGLQNATTLAASAGAGNPGGTLSKGATSTATPENGENGTGGVLFIRVLGSLLGSGKATASGAKGGGIGSGVGGAGSGGGHILIVCGEDLSTVVVDAPGGDPGISSDPGNLDGGRGGRGTEWLLEHDPYI